jgi:ribosomal protein S2
MNKEKTIESMFASGAHFGLGKSRRHPSLSTYIFGTKNGTDIFDIFELISAAPSVGEEMFLLHFGPSH